MGAPISTLSASLEILRDRARRLEEEAAALRADLEQMVALAEWEATSRVRLKVR